MRIMTILGTRPEIIRLSLIMPKLDNRAAKHIVVHTGQNHQHCLNDVFFEQLGLRKPDYSIRLSGYSLGEQLGVMFREVEALLKKESPDRILLLGDTNSALCALLCERAGVPVYHMEAGNRCFDRKVPEELNRKVIDAISSFNLPYTEISRDNLLREGVEKHRVWVSGNPIREVLQHYRDGIAQSDILQRMALKEKKYLVLTAHRSENVDDRERLQGMIDGLNEIAEELQLPVVCSVHPRLASRLQQFGIGNTHPLLKLCEPFGFFRLREASAPCPLRHNGQRHRAGGKLSDGRSGRNDTRQHGETGDDYVRQQRAVRLARRQYASCREADDGDDGEVGLSEGVYGPAGIGEGRQYGAGRAARCLRTASF